MKRFAVVALMVAMVSLGVTFAFGDDDPRPDNRGRRQGPPPEAYTACEGKSAGDAAEFVSPCGKTVTGTCEEVGDQLVLRPDNPRGRRGGRRQGPPPQAFAACEGKSDGDTASFENRRGFTVTGTCRQQGDRLVLRPDSRPGPGPSTETDE